MLSFSQNSEDVVLARLLSGVDQGRYIDIGAGHPINDSVTKYFYDRGWTGINIEPDERYFSQLVLNRPKDQNIQVCVSPEKGDVDFWVTKILGWSTSSTEVQRDLPPEELLQVEKRKVVLLDEILEMSSLPIHFLKIDCEGGEVEILESSSMRTNRPWIVVVESISPRKNQSLQIKIEECMKLKEYKFKLFDGLNCYFVDINKPELASSDKWYPACILDNYRKYIDIQECELLKVEAYQAVIQKEEALSELSAIDLKITQVMMDSQKQEVAYLHLEEILKASNLKITSLIKELNISKAKADSMQADLDSIRDSKISMQADLDSIRDSKIWKSTERYRKSKSKVVQIKSRFVQVWKREKDFYSFTKKLFIYLISQVRIFLAHKFPILNVIKAKSDKKTKHQDSFESVAPYRQVSSFGKPISIVSSLFKDDPFVLVGSTAQLTTNSGVQRVARSFVQSLVNQGFSPVLVKVDIAERNIKVLSDVEFKAFMKLIPSKNSTVFPNSQKFNGAVENGILLIPEVPYLGQADPLVCEVLLAFCNSNYLCTAAIYFDSIPLTQTGYGINRKPHESYLRFLSSCILVSSISKHSENELKKLLSMSDLNVSPQNPILVTKHLPLPSQLIENDSEEIENLLGRKFVLTVGTVEPRKNQGNLIKAFDNVYQNHKNPPVLVIVGNIRDDVRSWKLEANPNQVMWLNNLNDNKLRWLYENCLYTVFISLSEGYGYPILESQYFKKICVTSNFGSMKEVAAKGGCILVDNPTDLSEIQAALIQADETSIDNLQTMDFETWDQYTLEFYSLTRSLIREKTKEFRVLYWVDHTITFEANTGIQRVVRGIAKTLLDAGLELVPVKWNSMDSKFEIPNQEELRHLQNWSGPDSCKFSLELDENSEKPNFLVIPELTTYSHDEHLLGRVINFAKKLEIPVATVFHDAFPVKLSQVYSTAASQKHIKYMSDLIKSDLIFTLSKSVCSDVLNFILQQDTDAQTALARIVRIDLPSIIGQECFANSEAIESKKPAISGTKILCVGTLEPRKNHIKLLESFSKVLEKYNNQKVELILVGRSADEEIARVVQKFGETLPVFWKRNVSDSELCDLYQTCTFTIFPSIAEGVGLPILESLSFGKPVICGLGSAFDQISEQGGCLQVDVSDVDELAGAITALLSNQGMFELLESQAMNRTFTSWQEFGSNFTKILLNFNRRGSRL